MSIWFQSEAVEMCRAIEAVCPEFGCHVALTGGMLYKDGPRKDCDVLFYRIRQIEAIDVDGLFAALEAIGLAKVSGFGWCHKAEWRGKPVDCFFPENDGGDYEHGTDDLGGWFLDMTDEEQIAFAAHGLDSATPTAEGVA